MPTHRSCVELFRFVSCSEVVLRNQLTVRSGSGGMIRPGGIAVTCIGATAESDGRVSRLLRANPDKKTVAPNGITTTLPHAARSRTGLGQCRFRESYKHRIVWCASSIVVPPRTKGTLHYVVPARFVRCRHTQQERFAMGTTTFTIVLRRLSHVGSHWLVGDNRQ